MKYAAELYRPLRQPYHGLSELSYPFHDRTITVTQCICIPHPSNPWSRRRNRVITVPAEVI
jgi:hypothetical protein